MLSHPVSRRLVYAVLLLLGVFVAAEGVLRLSRTAWPDPYTVVGDALRKKRPGAWMLETDESSNLARFNNWGFHDLPRTARTDAFRVLVLGDSMVEGIQVPKPQSFTQRLEALVQGPDGAPIEVINAGVGGYGTGEEYTLWKTLFDGKVDYDHVVLEVHGDTDVYDNHQGYVRVAEDGSISTSPISSGGLDGVKNWLARNSAIFYTARRALWEARHPPNRNPAMAGPEAEALDPAGTLRLLDRWMDELEARGHGIALLYIPPLGPGVDDRLGAGLGALAGEKRVDLIIVEEDERETRFFVDGEPRHWNERGHEAAARALAPALTRAYRLEGPAE